MKVLPPGVDGVALGLVVPSPGLGVPAPNVKVGFTADVGTGVPGAEFAPDPGPNAGVLPPKLNENPGGLDDVAEAAFPKAEEVPLAPKVDTDGVVADGVVALCPKVVVVAAGVVDPNAVAVGVLAASCPKERPGAEAVAPKPVAVLLGCPNAEVVEAGCPKALVVGVEVPAVVV